MTLDQLRDLGLTIGAIAGGVGGVGFLYRKARLGFRLGDLLASLPERLTSIEDSVAALHGRMEAAETAHDETLVAIEAVKGSVGDVDTKVDSLDGKVGEHLVWSQGEMTRRTEAEAQLWDALKSRPDDA